MCGIAGISFPSTLTQTQREELTSAFAFVAESMEVRGTDSWGVATLFPDGSVSVARGMGRLSFGHACRFEDDAHAILVHTRYATQGRKVIRNAHFWHHGPLILAHNGGVWGDGGTKLLKRYDCDSEALAHEVGLAVQANRGKIAHDWTGYGSIHAIDSERENVLLSRMDGGDLEWCRITCPSGGSALVWASKLYDSTVKDLADLGFTIARHSAPITGAMYKINRGRFARLEGVEVGMSQGYRSHGRLRWDGSAVSAKPKQSCNIEVSGAEAAFDDTMRAIGYEEIYSQKHGFCWRHTQSGEVFNESGERVDLDQE